MGRLLQLLLLVALALIVWRLVRKALAPPRDGEPPRFEPTGRCAACGTHVPRGELDAAAHCPRCRGAKGPS
jgi:hypothetical protein